MIHSNSHPAVCSEVNVFTLPPTDTSTDTSYYAEYKSIVNVKDSTSKIEFRIQPFPTHYLDLSDSFLYVKFKIQKDDKTDLSASDDVSVANNFLHTIFSDCEVYSNNQLVSSSNNCYPYKAYLETLLKQ